MRWLATIEMMVPGLLLWASFVALVCIRDRVLYRLASRAPTAQKADALIREWLSPEQLREYEKRRKFEVTGSAGGRYLITSGCIRDLNTGQHICFVPENWSVLPAADVMLARKIALENDEAGALKVAYRLPY
jgi:hypothetical protein